MTYSILLHPKANDFLQNLDNQLKERIKNKLHVLSSDLEHGDKLKYSLFRQVRIGDYRAIYEIKRDSHRVIVLFIGHRKDVYDDFSRLL